jgi:hypothetical protein
MVSLYRIIPVKTSVPSFHFKTDMPASCGQLGSFHF